MRTSSRTSTARRIALLLAATLALAATAVSWGSPPSPKHGELSPVIVRALPGAETQAAKQTTSVGGVVGTRLAIVNGFSAKVPAAAVPKLRRLPGVLSVTPNVQLRPTASSYDPGGDSDSMASTTGYTGARDWWAAGYTGKGVDVALIDTGVSPVAGMRGTDKLVYGPDLSLESQAPNLTRLDTFGHGTFMAGLIAGRDDGVTNYAGAPASAYLGMAPDARVVSIKVGTADGGADVSQVIAAIAWVVQHAHDPGINIRVLNMSYGTNSKTQYAGDPLAYAAEQAWKKGIVVVAASGNREYQETVGLTTLADPAYDPYLLAIGASDSQGTTQPADDTVAWFSAGAPCPNVCRGPEIVAPGSHIQGLRVGNSWIDGKHPSAQLGERYFRGSGTSQSAAITSGAVALVLERYPQLTPDQVKRYLQDMALDLGAAKTRQGNGLLQLQLTRSPNLTVAPQSFISSNGKGYLEAARGTDHITRDGVVLTGEKDIFGKRVDTGALAKAEASGSSWSGGNWNGSSWSGSSWSGSSWSGSSWSGSSWSGSSWSGSSWSGSSWSGSSWSGSSWSGSSWSGSSWSGSSWSGASWS